MEKTRQLRSYRQTLTPSQSVSKSHTQILQLHARTGVFPADAVLEGEGDADRLLLRPRVLYVPHEHGARQGRVLKRAKRTSYRYIETPS